MTIRARGFVVLAALLAAACAHAQSAKVDGTWGPSRFGGPPIPPDAALLEKLTPGTTLLRNPGPPIFEYAAGDYGGLKLTPAARAEAAKWQPGQDQTVATVCVPGSVVVAMDSPFAIEIHQATELIALKLEYFDLVRLVFMDGRPHPGPEYASSKVGFSTGVWRDGVLTIDTTHLEASRITSNGANHTAAARVLEYVKLGADGNTLHWLQTIEDPGALEAPAARYLSFRRQPGYVLPYECDPSYGELIENRER